MLKIISVLKNTLGAQKDGTVCEIACYTQMHT